MDTLTPRQAEILKLIEEHTERFGYPPTRSEICDAMGFRSPNAAEEHLRALARKGVIEMIPGASRGIRLKQEPGVPVIGRVAAGSPILAAEHVEARYQLDPGLFQPRADYLLKVRGLSMRDAGILAVHRTTDFRAGQIVVARLQDEVTVKRIRKSRDRVELIPENPDFETPVVDLKSESLTTAGVAVGVSRKGSTI